MEYLPGFKKMAIITLSTMLVLSILLIFHYNNDFFQNVFVIKINDVDINARVHSEFRELFLIKNESDTYTKKYSSTKDLFYEIPLSDKYYITLNEYELYNKYGQRETNNNVNPLGELKEVLTSTNKLKVERMGNVLYDGEFITDLSDIITEEGRYYFHIYNKSKRTSSPIARVNSVLTFNVLVVNDED